MVMQHNGAANAVVGAASGLISMAIPDGVTSYLGKVAVGVSVAVISGIAHDLVKRLMKRWK